jgi:hypothetical protein
VLLSDLVMIILGTIGLILTLSVGYMTGLSEGRKQQQLLDKIYMKDFGYVLDKTQSIPPVVDKSKVEIKPPQTDVEKILHNIEAQKNGGEQIDVK